MNVKLISQTSLLIACLTCSLASAAKAPLSEEELKKEATLIVAGTIQQLRVKTERSRIETGFGNYDWGVYLTVAVDSVEKGETELKQLEVRCFRIKSRKTRVEYLTPGGNFPIPGKGLKVKMYLVKDGDEFHVIHPNGIASLDGTKLEDAPVIAKLRSMPFTYFLSLEVWVMLGLFLAASATSCLLVRFVIRWKSKETDTP